MLGRLALVCLLLAAPLVAPCAAAVSEVAAAERAEQPAPHSLSTRAARQWYLEQLAAIPERIDSSQRLEMQAREAYRLRREATLEARRLMADRAAAAALPPPREFEELVARAGDRGYQGEDVWRYIRDAASRSNRRVDAALGL